MSNILDLAIQACLEYKRAFCKFVRADDVGPLVHRNGICIPKEFYEVLFENPGKRGENKEKLVKITWQGDYETDSKFVWKGTKGEYRITRFGRGFPFFKKDDVGDFFILVKVNANEYLGFFLSRDEDIDDFFAHFNICPARASALIKCKNPH